MIFVFWSLCFKAMTRNFISRLSTKNSKEAVCLLFRLQKMKGQVITGEVRKTEKEENENYWKTSCHGKQSSWKSPWRILPADFQKERESLLGISGTSSKIKREEESEKKWYMKTQLIWRKLGNFLQPILKFIHYLNYCKGFDMVTIAIL